MAPETDGSTFVERAKGKVKDLAGSVLGEPALSTKPTCTKRRPTPSTTPGGSRPTAEESRGSRTGRAPPDPRARARAHRGGGGRGGARGSHRGRSGRRGSSGRAEARRREAAADAQASAEHKAAAADEARAVEEHAEERTWRCRARGRCRPCPRRRRGARCRGDRHRGEVRDQHVDPDPARAAAHQPVADPPAAHRGRAAPRRWAEDWPPRLAYEGLEARVKRVVGGLIRDEVLVREGDLEAAKVARLEDAAELETRAEQQRLPRPTRSWVSGVRPIAAGEQPRQGEADARKQTIERDAAVGRAARPAEAGVAERAVREAAARRRRPPKKVPPNPQGHPVGRAGRGRQGADRGGSVRVRPDRPTSVWPDRRQPARTEAAPRSSSAPPGRRAVAFGDADRAGVPVQPHRAGGVQGQVLGLARSLRAQRPRRPGARRRATARRPTAGSRRSATASPPPPTARSRRSRPTRRRSSGSSGPCATRASTCSTCTSRSPRAPP